jgi:hypothetical protein
MSLMCNRKQFIRSYKSKLVDLGDYCEETGEDQ